MLPPACPKGPPENFIKVGNLERPIAAPFKGIWENVLDWEHLPFLHQTSFGKISPISSGPWGWRAHVSLPPNTQKGFDLEVLADEERRCWVSRTFGGPPLVEIWSTAVERAKETTLIAIEFWIAPALAASADQISAEYQALYNQLWDEDAAMIEARYQQQVRFKKAIVQEDGPLVLGDEATLRDAAPLRFEMGGKPWWLVHQEGEWLTHSALCPHQLGPLPPLCPISNVTTCPWHGYRFEGRTGQRCDIASKVQLSRPPKLKVDPESGQITAYWEGKKS